MRCWRGCLRERPLDTQLTMTSSAPCRMAANMTCSSDEMKTTPPQVSASEARASVGGRDGSIDEGGRRNRKKYVRNRKAAKPPRRLPQRAWMST